MAGNQAIAARSRTAVDPNVPNPPTEFGSVSHRERTGHRGALGFGAHRATLRRLGDNTCDRRLDDHALKVLEQVH